MQASHPMSSADVIEQALFGCGIEDSARVEVPAVLDALKAAGYAVVKMPALEDVNDDFVLLGDEIRRYVPDGFGAYITFTIDEATYWATALLSLITAHSDAEVVR